MDGELQSVLIRIARDLEHIADNTKPEPDEDARRQIDGFKGGR